MQYGWFLIPRRWMESSEFKPAPYTDPQAYIWSVEQAAYAPHQQWFNGSQFPVERGQFVTSYRELARVFDWSVKRVRLFAQRMQAAGKWELSSTRTGAHGPTVVIICNYEHFQALPRNRGTAKGTGTDTVRTQSGNSWDPQQNLMPIKQTAGEQARSAFPSDAAALDEALDVWQAMAALSGWKPVRPKLNDARREGLAAILAEHGLEGWRGGLARARDSQFLGGPEPPAWWNFNFASRPDKFSNLVEGNYDEESYRTSRRGSATSGWAVALRRSIHEDGHV